MNNELVQLMCISEDGYIQYREALNIGIPTDITESGARWISEIIGNRSVIYIEGMLQYKAMWFGTSYSEIESAIKSAESNQEVESIEFVIACNGGDTQGISLVAEAIKNANKPTVATVKGNCFSAAYWIASQCDTIQAYPASEIGSVGVIQIYMNEKDLLPVRMIRSSEADNKSSTKEDVMLERLNNIESLMHADIAMGRNWDKENVGEITGFGKCFIASVALDKGLIDAIITEDNLDVREEFMNMNSKKYSDEELQTKIAEITQQVKTETEAKASESVKKAVAEDRQRCADIAECYGASEAAKTAIVNGVSAGEVALQELKQLRSQKEVKVQEKDTTSHSLADEMQSDAQMLDASRQASLEAQKDMTPTTQEGEEKLISEAFRELDLLEGKESGK